MVGPNEPEAIARRRLGRAGVIDGMVLEIVGHRLAAIEPLADLGVRESRATIIVPVSDRRVLIGCLDSSARISFIGRLRSICTTAPPSVASSTDGQEARGIVLELLEEHAVAGDLAEHLAVGRAGDAEADRQRGAVARQADDAHVVAEILAAELRADAELLRQLLDLLLQSRGRGRRGRPVPPLVGSVSR